MLSAKAVYCKLKVTAQNGYYSVIECEQRPSHALLGHSAGVLVFSGRLRNGQIQIRAEGERCMKEADPESRKGLYRLSVGSEREEPIKTTRFDAPIKVEAQSVMSATAECELNGNQVFVEISAKTLNYAFIKDQKEWAQVLRELADKLERVRFI
jgi:hypothetical protein